MRFPVLPDRNGTLRVPQVHQFNICGNKYRLVAKINYAYSIVYIRFAGSHREYDEINAQEI